jgi:hypothetical protein
MNEAFMYFGVFGVVFNIIGRSVQLARSYRLPLTSNSYGNVLRAKRAAGQPTIQPLVGLLPFVLLAAQHAAWLLFAPAADGRGILHSSLFLPFAGAWGLQFAHAVGRLILAHVTRAPFPMFDTVTLVSALGAADAALPALLGVYVLPPRPAGARADAARQTCACADDACADRRVRVGGVGCERVRVRALRLARHRRHHGAPRHRVPHRPEEGRCGQLARRGRGRAREEAMSSWSNHVDACIFVSLLPP